MVEEESNNIPCEEDEFDEEDEEVSDEEEGLSVEGAEFENEEAALAARKQALALYNKDDIDGAIRIQSGVAAFFSKLHSEVDPRCALYFLDYGMSLLAQLQALPAIDAALAGNTGKYTEEFEICYNTLELARRGFDQQLNEIDDDNRELFSQTTLRLAEAHDSLALLNVEKDDDDSAIREFSLALALRREVLESKHRLVVSTEFSIGETYLHAEDFEKAEEQFEKTLKLAYDGGMDEELIARIQEKLSETSEMKKGGLDEAREEIQKLFPDEEDCIKETDEDNGNSENIAGTCISQHDEGDANRAITYGGPSDSTPLLTSKVSEMIFESNVHSRSLANIKTVNAPSAENSSSSLFPKQSACSRGFNVASSISDSATLADAPVNVSSVVRKVKVAKKQPRSTTDTSDIEQQKKKIRTES